MIIIPFLWILVGSIVCFSSYGMAGTYSKALRSRQLATETQIIGRMFSEYDSNVRPPVRDSAEHATIVVITNIHINRINWLTYTAEVDLYLRQQWEDTRLAYDVDVREEIQEVPIPRNKKIWVPDTYFGTAREKYVGEGGGRDHVVIEPSGYVRSSEQRLVEVVVENNIAFPFHNSKSFRLRLASYNYPIEDVVYMWANSPPTIVPVEVSDDLVDGGPYTMTDAYVGDCIGNYSVGMYSCIDVVVTFSGSASAPVFQLFCPSIFLVISSWLHFWIHGSWSVPRTFSAAIPFLIFTILVIFYPQPYLGFTGIGATQVWLIFCLGITFFSLLEYFIVICAGSGTRRVRYNNTPHINNPEHAPLTTTIEGVEVQYETKKGNLHATSSIDVVARILFPVVFIIFVVIFLIFYLI